MSKSKLCLLAGVGLALASSIGPILVHYRVIASPDKSGRLSDLSQGIMMLSFAGIFVLGGAGLLLMLLAFYFWLRDA